jgi:hypothetical protein
MISFDQARFEADSLFGLLQIDSSFYNIHAAQKAWVSKFAPLGDFLSGDYQGPKYHPSKPFHTGQDNLLKRVASLSQIIRFKEKWESSNDNFIPVLQSVHSQLLMDSPANRQKALFCSSGKPKEMRFTSAFHKSYSLQNNGHPRFVCIPGNSVMGLFTEFKSLVLERVLEIIGEGVILELDLSKIHLTAAASALGPERAPSLYKELTLGSNYWTTLIEELSERFQNLNTLDFSVLKRIVKIIAYAPLNSGNPLSWTEERYLKSTLGNVFTTNGEEALNIKELRTDILNILRVNDISTRINESLSIHKVILDPHYDEPTIWLLNDPHEPYRRIIQGTRGPQRAVSDGLPSAFYSSIEVVMLTVIPEIVLRYGGVILGLEHDGCLIWMPSQDTTTCLLEETNKSLNTLGKNLLGLSISAETKKVWDL